MDIISILTAILTLFGGVGVHAYPVFGRQVERFADAVIACLEFVYPFGLAFERNNAVMVDVQKREHVSADIEHQHVRRIPERRER